MPATPLTLTPGETACCQPFGEQAEAIVQDCGEPTELILVLRDRELIRRWSPERNVDLLRALYPAMQVLSMLVGADWQYSSPCKVPGRLPFSGCWAVAPTDFVAVAVPRQLFPTLVGLLAGATILTALPTAAGAAHCGVSACAFI